MKSIVRTVMYAVVVFQTFFAVATFFQWPVATALWPFAGTTPLTYIFIASIFAAAAAATWWAVASRNEAALAGIALDYIVILGALSVFAMSLGLGSGIDGLVGFGLACGFGTVFGVGLLAWSVRLPLDRSRPMPGLVRWSFVVFIVALVIVGVRLILRHPNVIPWTITPELSVVIGVIFFGAAVYFAYGLLRPSWANSGGQLAGFLAYDVVLIVPFLQRLPTVAPEHRLGLIIYTAVVTYSGLLAAYFLFLHDRTRLWSWHRAAASRSGPVS
jgi:hypothetical protein